MAQLPENPEQVSVASGATDVFPTVWTFEDANQVVVSVDAGVGFVELREGVDYDVSPGDWLSGGADIIFRPGKRPASGDKVARVRRTPVRQDEEFGDLEEFRPRQSEWSYDRLTRMIQERDAVGRRAVTVPLGDDGLELPMDRASRFLAFDAERRPIAAQGAVEGVPATAPAAQLLDDASFSQMRDTLDVPVNGGDLGDFDPQFQRDADGAVKRPFVNFMQERRNLTDFIDRSQWAAIRNGTATAPATNSLGQDSFAAATADISNNIGGKLFAPEGKYRLPVQVLDRQNYAIEGQGAGTIFETASATAHQLDMAAPFISIEGLHFVSSVARTAGACVRMRNSAARAYVRGLRSHGAFSLLQLDGHPIDPALDAGIFTAENLRAYETVQGGHAYVIGGGYLVELVDIVQAGDNAFPAQTGVLLKRCADFRLRSFQLLNVQRPLDVIPASGSTIASFKAQDGYCGTSVLGSRVSCTLGGKVLSSAFRDVWLGETSGVDAPGLLVDGQGGEMKVLQITDCQFPLATGDGLTARHLQMLMMSGGWIDGCGGSGIALQDVLGGSVIGVRSGADRFGGNAFGAFIDAPCSNLRIALNDFRNNVTGSFVNGASGSVGMIVEHNQT